MNTPYVLAGTHIDADEPPANALGLALARLSQLGAIPGEIRCGHRGNS